MRKTLLLAAGPILALAVAGTAAAQNYPNKPIRLIVPFSAGGTTDIIGRLVGAEISRELGQQVIVENRGGAGSTLGTALAAAAAPDGYTMILNNSGLAYNATLYPKLPYDTLKDLAPISMIGVVPNILGVHPSVPVKAVGDLLKLARAQPGKLTYGSGGVGSSSHLAVELLEELTRTEFIHVPYKGAAPALIDLVAGHTDFIFNSMPAVLPHARSKRLRAIAVSSTKRSPAAPELPTVAESGVKDYDYVTWYGLLVPAKTPQAVVDRLNGAVQKLMAGAEIRKKLSEQGIDAQPGTADAFGQVIRADVVKWGEIIRKAGIKAR